MPTLLCHITLNPGRERQFEAAMKEMYRRTHADEPGCIRYEYYRAAEPGKYYCLLSFSSRLAFLIHQTSEYHEGFDFAAMIASLVMEWIDPVGQVTPVADGGGLFRISEAADPANPVSSTQRPENPAATSSLRAEIQSAVGKGRRT